MNHAFEHIQQVKIVAILRGDYRGAWAEIGAALIEGGITAIEITLNSPDALDGIKQLSQHYSTQAMIGAGTVLTPEAVASAVDAGATYIVAPNTNPDVIAACLKHNVLPIPGAYTPTEIEFAYRHGAPIIKLFPSMPIGPDYLKQIRGPLPHIPIMCTGGITLDNFTDFLQAGANAVGTGWLVSADTMTPGGLARTTDRARQMSSRVLNGAVAKTISA